MKNWFKYLFIFSLLEFYSSVISAQAPVNYIVEIVELDMSGSGSCDDGQELKKSLHGKYGLMTM